MLYTNVNFYDQGGKRFLGSEMFEGTPKKTEFEWYAYIKKKFPDANGNFKCFYLKMCD